jgi:predicted MFS family arabinose efflux permease
VKRLQIGVRITGILTPFRTAVVAFAAIWGTGLFSQAMSPFLVGTLISDGGLDPRQAGLVQSTELVAIAAMSLLLSFRIHRLSKRLLAISGALLVVTMHFLSAASIQLDYLMVCRGLAGVGAGLVLAAGNAFVAEASEPERLYGRICITAGVVFTMTFSGMGFLAEAFGIRGIYVFEALWVGCMILLLRRLPNAGVSRAVARDDSQAVPLGLTAIILTGALLFAICDVGVWSFSERIASSVGISTHDVGLALAASSVLGIVGASAVVVLGKRCGGMWPLVVGLALFALLCFTVMTATTPWMFLVAIIVYQAGFTFTVSYLYGTAAYMDPGGRVIVATSGAALIGAAIAPYAMGLVVRLVGFAVAGWYVLFVLLLVGAMMASLLLALGRRAAITAERSRRATLSPQEA